MTDLPPAPAPRPCPICGKPSVKAHAPFCSVRCADIDLNRWLSGSYVIAGDRADPEGEAEGPAVPDPDEEA